MTTRHDKSKEYGPEWVEYAVGEFLAGVDSEFMEKSAKNSYTKPELRERIKSRILAGSEGEVAHEKELPDAAEPELLFVGPPGWLKVLADVARGTDPPPLDLPMLLVELSAERCNFSTSWLVLTESWKPIPPVNAPTFAS
jgi:hypothetical protein